MGSYSWDFNKNAFTKHCDFCDLVVVGCITEEHSIVLFSKYFYKYAGSGGDSDGFRNACVRCVMNNFMKRNYGISLQEAESRLKNQGGKCAICEKPLAFITVAGNGAGAQTSANIDHDSETGFIRGILCWHCNTGIGKFQHKSTILKQALKYIVYWERSQWPR